VSARPDNATALVTGASKGIGAAIARALAADGWLVGVNYRSDEAGALETVKGIEEAGGKAVAIHGDVAENGGGKALLKQLATNLSAAFRLTRDSLRGMIKARYGRVVNIASVVGPRANAGQSNYAAAKAGLIGMTKTVAAEVARRGVTVNAVAPGFIDTDMTSELAAEEIVKAIPARRQGTPEEVAAAVRFLASDDAGYVTGTTLYVDGGMSA
jgi:3-oxoacyl-[acyl-carrier protein] reductase